MPEPACSGARLKDRAYPSARYAFERKRFYDPDEIFSNQFYALYGRNRQR